MTPDQLAEIAHNEVLRGRLAKIMALECFRNSELENLHAGKFPSSTSGDYLDVKVVSPNGDIAWNELSRLSDDEMKVLMIDVVNHCDKFLYEILVTSRGETIMETIKERDPVPKWYDPEKLRF
jgi:hypothetical protein